MPVYTLEAPDGRRVTIEGPDDATVDELEAQAAMAIQGAAPDMRGQLAERFPPPTSLEPGDTFRLGTTPVRRELPFLQEAGRNVLGAGQVAATVASGALAEPVAGIAGGITAVVSGAERASQVIRSTQDALTIPLGSSGADLISEVGASIPEPIKRSLGALGSRFESFADLTAETFGPIAGAAVKAAPTAAAELAGMALGRKVMRASNKAMMSRKRFLATTEGIAPSIEDLRDASRGIYRELEASGTALSKAKLRELGMRAANVVKQEGTRFGSIQKKAAKGGRAVLATIKEMVEDPGSVTLSDIMALRQATRSVIKPQNPERAASLILDEIDEFLDTINVSHLTGGQANAGQQVKLARDLYRRAKRSESIQDVLEAARSAPTGFENQVRLGFDRLIKGKSRRFFTAEELTEMKEVAAGKRGANLFKKLGKFGFGEGRGTSMTMTTLGAYLGFQAGGPVGAAVVPAIGMVSRRMARRLTEKGAAMADQIIRAGSDGGAITTIYLNQVPAAQRSARDLASLLVRPDVRLDGLPFTPITRDAIERVSRARTRTAELMAGAAAGGVAAQGSRE